MFARLVECRVQSGRSQELNRVIKDQAIPILQKQSGFVDEITLVSQNEPDRVFAISFWTNKADAERYNREQFPKIAELLKPVLQGEPRIHPCNVSISTISRISVDKAA
jgi:quinol monooxygenase YgiN